ncbi:MAG TPA: phosphatidate cytidylyltransferase [Herpetosiphonaceae bacterium]
MPASVHERTQHVTTIINPELIWRLATATLLVPLTIGVIVAGGWLMAGMLAGLAAGGAHEFYRLAARRGVYPLVALGCAASAGFVIVTTVNPTPGKVGLWLWLMTIGLLFVAAVVTMLTRTVDQQPFATIGVTVAGALWTGGSLVFLVLLRSLAADLPATIVWSEQMTGAALALFPVVLVWSSDSLAYLVGRSWGRHRLLPRVSPGKSWEGAIAGFAATLLVGVVYTLIIFDLWLALPISAFIGGSCGALAGLFGPLGDLAKSALKREAGVKDAGRIFPGHGGIIDRFDALFIVVPLVYGVLRLVLERASPGG